MPRKIARGMRRLKPVRPNQKLAVEYARSLLAIVKKVRADVARVLSEVGREYIVHPVLDGCLQDARKDITGTSQINRGLATGMRPESFAKVKEQRASGEPMRPIRIEVYPGEDPVLVDGRHRLAVAKAAGDKSIEAHVVHYDKTGAPLREEKKTIAIDHDQPKSKPNLKPLDKLANEWAGLQGQAKKIAKNVAYKALAQVDEQVAGMIKSTIAVDVSPLLKRDTRIGKEVDACIQWNVELIQDVPAKFIDDVRDFVEENWSSGRRWEELVDEIDARLGGNAESRAKLIARDQTAKMNGTLNRVRQQNLGIDQYEWSASNDERTRPMHANLDGKIFSWDRPPVTNEDGDENHPGEDFACFTAETLIKPSARVRKIFKRAYAGYLTTLVTASGPFRATENHPVLTQRGWLPAHLVQISDDVFEVCEERVLGTVCDPERANTSIGEIFSSLLVFGCERALSPRVGFHGDTIIDQEVDVVRIDWDLLPEFHSSISKHFCERLLNFADQSALGRGNFGVMFGSVRATSDSLVSGACKLLSLLESEFRHALVHSGTSIAWLDTAVDQIASNGSSLDAELFRKCVHTPTLPEQRAHFLARVIVSAFRAAVRDVNTSLDHVLADSLARNAEVRGQVLQSGAIRMKPARVLNVDRVFFRGHVYSFETDSGWFVAHNRIVHNCRCVAIPVINPQDLETDLQGELFGEDKDASDD